MAARRRGGAGVACHGHQPPGSGSAYTPNGAEMAVAFLDEAGDVLPVGATGEVVVRGASVMQSYDDAAANQNTCTQGWFRTGDQGYMDAAGYLFITGRIKEAINRGGEKITPQEVDDVLLDHPAVAQAVTFAMPHTLQFAGSGVSTWGLSGWPPWSRACEPSSSATKSCARRLLTSRACPVRS